MLNLTLERIERQIRNLPVEHVYVLGPENEVLFHHTDDQHSRVLIPGEIAVHLPGALVTHNHPGGRSLSPTDVLVARRARVREMRAVTRTHRYSVTPPDHDWSSTTIEDFSAVVKREQGLILAKLDDQIARGQLTRSMLDLSFHHRLCERLAECGILHYSAEKW